MSEPINRREFVRNSAALGAVVASFGVSGTRMLRAADAPSPDRSAEPPSRKVIIGVMGLGRGRSVAEGFAQLPGVEVKYLCDVDDKRIAEAVPSVSAKAKSERKPETVKDFRRILDDKDVNAIAIAAPDHWHAPAAILACAAGKHVYVEKPCCHNPHEGELLVEAAKKHNRVVQHGSQRRSWSKVVEAVEKVRAGEWGKMRYSRGWYNANRGSIGHGKPAPVPANLDYNLWQGPAPEQDYRSNLIHYNWHWFWHWGTGELGNNGVHSLDICRWGLGVDYPRSVTASGGRYYYDDDQQTPDTHVVTYDFGDKGMITWEGQSCQPRGFEGSQFGISFHGTEASVVIDGNGYRVFDPKAKEIAKASAPATDREHFQNFIDGIRADDAGRGLHAPIDEGYKSVLLCHLGNIAYRTGRRLHCDPQTGRVLEDREAQALWKRSYREGWEPKV